MCKKLIYLISIVLLLVTLPAAAHAQVVNLLPNPSFEEDEVVLDDPDWFQWCTWNPAEGAGSNATIVDTDSVDGTKSLRIEPVGPENWHFIVVNISFAADLDKNYTASFWAKAEAPRPLTVQMKASDNSVSEWGGTGFDLTTEWAEYSYTSEVLHTDVKLEFLCAGSEVPFLLDLVTVSEAPVTIPVLNAGFEDPVLAEDDWTWLDVTGWTWVGGEGPGIWHVTSADFDPVVAPEGQNVLYSENAVGDAGGVAQVLTETFAANTDYTLTAEVGNSYYYYFAGYSVQLLAGGTVIAEDNDTLWPDYMKWATSTVQYTYDSADSALVGQPLEIRLLNLGLDKDNPPDNTVGVEFDNVTLSYEAGAEPGVTITVEEGGDIAAANELAKAGDTIEIAAGTYVLVSQIEIKDGVTYRGAGPGLTIIDGNDVTRAFAAWGDRSLNNGNENPNDSGPKGWVLEGMTIQNCVADTNNRFSYAGAAFNMLDDFADNDVDASGGLNADEADDDVGAIRLPGADGTEPTEDDDLHRFTAMDADGNGELSEAELNDQLLSTEEEFGDEDGDGGAITIHNESVGTIANCDFLANHTPAEGDGDDGGAINITGRSTITINDCFFNGNYACSPDSVSIDGADGDAGHIKAQGNNLTNGFINVGTTLIINRCVFLNGNAEDDAGAIQANAQGIVVRIDSCWFEGNTSWDNGTVLQFPNEDQNEATVTNCVFTNNITNADNSPDRMCEVRRNTTFVNCTFVGNVQEDQDLIYNNANAADGDHDGTDDEMADVTQVINCIFANNVVGNGDDVLGSRNNDFSIAATNCLFFGNTLQNGNAADNTQRPADETGSLLSDPLLDADYVPTEGSEAIDGGVDPAIVGVTLTNDYNGDTRPQGAGYDIGAFEVGATSTVDDGLVAYYSLENNTEDGSGNGFHGTIVGNPTYVEGLAGNGMAMEFDGESYVDCGNDAGLDITGPISISLWIRPGADDPEGQGTATAPMAKADSGASPPWSWQVRYGWNSPQPYMAFTFNTSPRAWVYVGKNLERDEWAHIACSHDGATLKCYLDGVETDSTPMGAITSSSTSVLIGSDGWRSDWIGAIDEVRIYDRAVSEAEILELATK